MKRSLLAIGGLLLWLSTSLLSNIQAADLDVRTYIPANALVLLPTVRAEQQRIYPELPIPAYMGSLIEHESCITLTHSKCWNGSSQLKTEREIGIGVFQITKAYNKTGAVRFDTLTDLKSKYPKELGDLTWDNIKMRIDLQIRAGLLLSRDNFLALKTVEGPINRMRMADAAYNGGLGNVNKARRACGLAKDCSPNVWFGNVEIYMPQSKSFLYGKRSAYDIVTYHVKDTTTIRIEKYYPYFAP